MNFQALKTVKKWSSSRQASRLAVAVILLVSVILAYLLHVRQESFGRSVMDLTTENVRESIVRGSLENIRDVQRMSRRMALIKGKTTSQKIWKIDAEKFLSDLLGVDAMYLLDKNGVVINELSQNGAESRLKVGYDFKQKKSALTGLNRLDSIAFSPVEKLPSGKFISYAFTPIYNEREKLLKGYLGVRVCIKSFVRELLLEPVQRAYLLKIYFGDQLIFRDQDDEGSYQYKDSQGSFSIDLDGDGTSWKYVVYPAKHIAKVFRTPYPFVIMAIGILISLLVYSLLQSKAKSKRQNQALKAEVKRRKESENRLREARNHDNLTQLPNQHHLRNYVLGKVSGENGCQSLTLVHFDLDSFKDVNSSFGHHIGDRLLQMIGQRIQPMIAENNLLAHLGSDEFVICLSRELELREAESFGLRVLGLLEEPFEIDRHVVRITASVGVASYPKHADGLESLLLCVDTALQRAKGLGKNHVVVYNEKIATTMKDRMNLLQEIHDGISKSEFCMFYQPKFDTHTRRLTGVEALIRWYRDGVYVPPVEFLQLMEDTGLIINIGMDTMERACIEYLELFGKDSDVKLAINLAAKQVEYPGLVEQLLALFEKHQFPLHNLEIELTEQSLIEDFDDSMLKIHRLSRSGISIAIDDFGVGYSSLSYLKRFPINTLKIDKSFVLDIVEDKDDLAIVKTIIAMGHGLGLEIVAEGVETEEQMDILKQERCDQVQGYLLGKPLSFDDLTLFYTTQIDETAIDDMDLDETDLDETDLDETDLDETDLDETDLDETDLDETDLDETDLDETDLDETDLDETDLDETDLDETDLDETDLDETDLDETDLDETDLDETDLDETDLDETDLDETDLDETDLDETDLDETDLDETDLDETDLDETDLDETDLDETDLDETDLDETDLDETDLDETDLDETDLDETDLDEADLDEADLDETDLDETDLDETDLDETDLDETDLDETDLDETDLDETKLDETKKDK